MTKVQNPCNEINFWVEDSIPGCFLIGSDIIASYPLPYSDFEQWLLSINRIGCFYDDGDYSTGDIIVTLEDVLESIDPTELNDLIDEFMKKNVLPKSGIEFEKLLQAYKFPEMWDFANTPTEDKYRDVEGQQRPNTYNPQQEKELLKTI